MARKYILQYGNIAGISYGNALALRKAGVESRNIIPCEADRAGTDQKEFDRQLPSDKILYSTSAGKAQRLLRKLGFCQHVVRNCSLVHYHGSTILRRNLDCALFHYFGIPMIISWAGGDARIVSIARKNNPYFYRMPDEAKDNGIRRRLESLSKYVRYVATDPEMAEYSLPYFEKVFIVHQPIDLSECSCRLPERDARKPVVLHIPTHREVKGTAYIEAAIERLKSEGLSFEFRFLVPTLTQRQVRQEIGKADIYVDELRCGSYGITAVESMASGNPTLTYIREDLVGKYPADLPLVNVNPDTIYTKLRELILDGDLRREIGLRSREYAEKYHSLEVVGSRLLDIYREIGYKDGLGAG